MPDGELGVENPPGSGNWEDSNIPGSKDDGEVWEEGSGFGCIIGSLSKKGPMGIVTKFIPDGKKLKCHTEYGDPKVEVDGAETCVIIPQTKVCEKSGMMKYYEWYQGACTRFGWSDYFTIIKFKKEEPDTIIEKSVMRPQIVCQTNWSKAALDFFLGLLKAGLGSDEAKKQALKLIAMKSEGEKIPKNTEEFLAYKFSQDETFGKTMPKWVTHKMTKPGNKVKSEKSETAE